MLLKYLIMGLIIYALYRYFFKPLSLGGGPRRDERHIDSSSQDDEGEYIDYEEVD